MQMGFREWDDQVAKGVWSCHRVSHRRLSILEPPSPPSELDTPLHRGNKPAVLVGQGSGAMDLFGCGFLVVSRFKDTELIAQTPAQDHGLFGAKVSVLWELVALPQVQEQQVGSRLGRWQS